MNQLSIRLSIVPIVTLCALAVTQAQIVTNGSFELPDIADNSFQYNPATPSWTFNGNSGIIDAPSTFLAPEPPHGAQLAFIHKAGTTLSSFSQSVVLPGGTHELSWFDAGAPRADGEFLEYDIFIDERLLLGSITVTGDPFRRHVYDFGAVAGTYTLSFRQTPSQFQSTDYTAFFDNVQIVKLVPEPGGLPAFGLALLSLCRRPRNSLNRGDQRWRTVAGCK